MPTERRIHPSLVDATPLFIVMGFFLLISAINWQYEFKFFQPVPDHGHDNYYFGPFLFLSGQTSAFVSSIFFFLLRKALSDGGGLAGADYLHVTGSGLVSLVCLAFGLGCIVLGPAAITMMEQMAPR